MDEGDSKSMHWLTTLGLCIFVLAIILIGIAMLLPTEFPDAARDYGAFSFLGRIDIQDSQMT